MANDFADLGFEPEKKTEDHSDIGFEPDAQAQPTPDAGGGIVDTVKGAVKNALGDIPAIATDIGKRVFSATEGIAKNPVLQSLDPATKAGFVLQNTIQGVFDEGGELTATRLATGGLNPYLSAAAGTVVQEIPDIVFSAEGIAAIKAAGNARAEAALLDRIAKAHKVFSEPPIALEYKPGMGPIEAPKTSIESGPAIPLESKEMGLLKGSTPKALPEPEVMQGEGFTMRDKPDLAKLQEQSTIPRSEIQSGLEVEHYTHENNLIKRDEGVGATYFSPVGEGATEYGDFKIEKLIKPEAKIHTIDDTYAYLEERKLLDKPNTWIKEVYGDKLKKLGLKPTPRNVWDEIGGSLEDTEGNAGYRALHKVAFDDIKSRYNADVVHMTNEDDMLTPNQYAVLNPEVLQDKVKKYSINAKAVQEGAQPTYPEDKGKYSLRGYASRKKLSANVPDFQQVQQTVAPADLYNPVVSELVDESRKQYVGVDPRLEMVKDTETGQTMFRLKKDPPTENRVVTETEHSSNQATKNSAAVNEMSLDPRIVDSSPNLPGTETVPALKDTVVAGSRGWIQDNWNRIGAASEDVISRMGQFGKQLAGGIRTLRDVPQVRYGEFSAGFDKFLNGMSKKQAKEVSIGLSDALEGRTPKTKLPEGMLEFVQQKLKVIADEAEAVGLKIRNSDGEVSSFAARENYFPRILRQEIFDGLISGDNKVMSEIAQKMVNNKQQPNFHVAFEKVKYMRTKMMSNKYGHLERAREVDLSPELYDRNALRVIPEYINSALHRIEEVRQFGLEGEKALGMLNAMQQEGHDAQLARAIFERFTRIEPRDNVLLKGMQGLRNVTAGMLIQAQSTALQLGQAMMPAYEAGFTNSVKGFYKAWTSLGEQEARKAGQVFSIAAQDYLKESYGGGSYGFGSKFAEGVFKMTGFTRMDHFLRKYASLTGKEYIAQLVNKLLKDHGNRTAIVELEHLGFTPKDIIKEGGLSETHINVGAKRFADMTQGAPDVTRLPYWWTSPGGKLFAQFKNFSYLIGKQNVSLIKRAFQTGNVTRLGEMAVGLPMTGYVIGKLREAMTGQGEYQITGNEEVDQVINVLGNATAFGPSVDLFLSAIQGPYRLKSFFLPISIANAAEIGGAVGKALKDQDAEYLVKTLLKKTPVVGRAIANQVYGE